MAKKFTNTGGNKASGLFDSKVTAKQKADTLLKQKQELNQLDKQWRKLNLISKEWEVLADKKKKGQKIDEDRLKALQDEYGSVDKLDKIISTLGDKYNTLNINYNSLVTHYVLVAMETSMKNFTYFFIYTLKFY
jgi:hypothetical protein